MTVADPESESLPGIFKVSEQGDPVGFNLRGVTFCRLCTSSALGFSDASTHSSEFGCLILLQENAVSCPLCSSEKFTIFREFAVHMRTHVKDFMTIIEYKDRPEGTTKYNFEKYIKSKAFSILWMLQLCKKLYEASSENNKLFLPHMSYNLIAATRPHTKLLLCEFTVCVSIGGPNFQHEHKFETLRDGACYKCGLYHHYILTGSIKRVCTRKRYKGILPL